MYFFSINNIDLIDIYIIPCLFIFSYVFHLVTCPAKPLSCLLASKRKHIRNGISVVCRLKHYTISKLKFEYIQWLRFGGGLTIVWFSPIWRQNDYAGFTLYLLQSIPDSNISYYYNMKQKVRQCIDDYNALSQMFLRLRKY